MANPDDQFDEFDNLVDDAVTPGDNFSPAYEDRGRKKRKTIFYAILGGFILLAAVAAWFVFFNQPATSPAESLPASVASAEQAASLPPGVDATTPGDAAAQPTPGSFEAAQQDSSTVTTDVPADVTAQVPGAEAMPTDQNSATTSGATTTAADATTPSSLVPTDATTAPTAGDTPATAEALPPPTDTAASGFETETPAESPTNANSSTNEAVATTPVGDAATPAALPTAQQEAALPQDSAMVAETPPVAATATNDAAEQRIAQLEQQVQTLMSELQAVKTAAPPSSNSAADAALVEQVKQLNDKLDQVDHQVDALDQRTTTLATELQKRPETSANMSSDTSSPDVQEAPKPKPAAPKKPVHSAAKPSVGGWELRSAQPGVAWLGKAGTGDMGRYAVGQSVPGLGTVQTVTEENGRWIVRTTGGTIRE